MKEGGKRGVEIEGAADMGGLQSKSEHAAQAPVRSPFAATYSTFCRDGLLSSSLSSLSSSSSSS
eukprot:12428006-Karenia_brevis.AAC.1